MNRLKKNVLKTMDLFNGSYRFKVGAFNCTAISDGVFTYSPPTFPPPVTFFFSNAPKEDLAQALHRQGIDPAKWAEWTSPYICLVINTGENIVLVDTGAGSLGPSTGKLVQNLKSKGISTKDIDTVILAHGHPDHIDGNIVSEGGSGFPAPTSSCGKMSGISGTLRRRS